MPWVTTRAMTGTTARKAARRAAAATSAAARWTTLTHKTCSSAASTLPARSANTARTRRWKPAPALRSALRARPTSTQTAPARASRTSATRTLCAHLHSACRSARRQTGIVADRSLQPHSCTTVASALRATGRRRATTTLASSESEAFLNLMRAVAFSLTLKRFRQHPHPLQGLRPRRHFSLPDAC